MKIYLKAYLRNNLGDDLFVKAICDAFREHDFAVLCYERNKTFKKIPNLKTSKVGLIDKTLNKITHKQVRLKEQKLINSSKQAIYIGGSIFIQKEIGRYPEDLAEILNDKPYHIVGFNVGPYLEPKYIDYLNTEIFAKAKTLTVRDNESCSLIKTNKAVCAPDILLSAKLPRKESSKKKYALISVIDMHKKKGVTAGKKYDEYIIAICDALENKGIKPILVSFCKSEGDEVAMDRIRNLRRTECYRYAGDLDGALSMMAGASYVVGTRFHATILSINLGIPHLAISYSKKTDNALRLIGYPQKIYGIDDLNADKAQEDIEASIKGLKGYEVEKYKKMSKKHFEELRRNLN